MDSPQYREEEQRASEEIESTQQERQAIEDKQDTTAVKTVYKVSAERPHQHYRYRISREDKTYRMLAGKIRVAEIQGQDWDNEHEGEIEHEVCCPCLSVVTVPKGWLALWCHRCPVLPRVTIVRHIVILVVSCQGCAAAVLIISCGRVAGGSYVGRLTIVCVSHRAMLCLRRRPSRMLSP